MKRYLPLFLTPSAAFAHSGHDIQPTPEGLHHAMGDAGHLGVVLGAAALALVVLAAVVAIRHRRRTRA